MHSDLEIILVSIVFFEVLYKSTKILWMKKNSLKFNKPTTPQNLALSLVPVLLNRIMT